jgi:hypothetical protein
MFHELGRFDRARARDGEGGDELQRDVEYEPRRRRRPGRGGPRAGDGKDARRLGAAAGHKAQDVRQGLVPLPEQRRPAPPHG